MPDVAAVVIAYAGGGLSCGIGAAIRAVRKSTVKLYAAEVETGAPFAASKRADLAILMSAACSAVRRFVALGRAAAAKAMRRCYRQLLRPPNPSLSSLLRASKRCTCLAGAEAGQAAGRAERRSQQ